MAESTSPNAARKRRERERRQRGVRVVLVEVADDTLESLKAIVRDDLLTDDLSEREAIAMHIGWWLDEHVERHQFLPGPDK